MGARNLNWRPDWKENSNTGKRKNKFNATSCVYDNYTYQSKKEASKAMELDWRLKSGEIESWTRQHAWQLYVNGKKIRQYSIDFRVVCNDGTIEYIEVKGAEDYAFQITWKLTQAIFDELTPEENARLFKNSRLVLQSFKNQMI